jgi:ABC-2 type transport system permease protein
VLVRILASGAAVAVFYAALSLAAASLTDRRAVAAIGTFIFVNATGVVAGILVEGLKLADWFAVLSLNSVPFQLARMIHGETLEGDIQVNVWAVVGAAVAWTTLFVAVAWQRYRRLQVTR